MLPILAAALKGAGEKRRAIEVALDVRELGRIRPDLLICDVDGLDLDPLEVVRQLRFILPSCMICVYTADEHQAWGLACHLAGANCLLSKASSEAELIVGLQGALASGCYTDPRFAA